VVSNDRFHANGERARLHDGDGLGMALLGDEKLHPPLLAPAVDAEVHGLGRGRSLVEQGGVGDGQACQICDHGLEIQKRLQAALGDFGLIGGVLGVPARIFEQVALNHRRDQGVVVSQPDEAAEHLVFGGDGAEIGQGLGFGEGSGEVEFTAQPNALGDGFVDQGLCILAAEGLEHGSGGIGVWADVTLGKAVGMGKSHRGWLGKPINRREDKINHWMRKG
jgi:hypothetical protein